MRVTPATVREQAADTSELTPEAALLMPYLLGYHLSAVISAELWIFC